MKIKCPNPTEFDAIEKLQDTDPMRLHLAECPRCSALIKAQAVFEAQPDLSAEEESRCQDADETMSALLADKLFPSGENEVTPPAEGGSGSEPTRRPNVIAMPDRSRRSFSWWPGMAAAAVAVALCAVFLFPDKIDLPFLVDSPSSEVPMRGGEDKLPQEFTFPVAHHGDDGVLTVQWVALEGAETYQILFWSESLQVIETIPTGTSTSYRFSDQAVALPAEALFFCVVAKAGENEIGRSEMVSLP